MSMIELQDTREWYGYVSMMELQDTREWWVCVNDRITRYQGVVGMCQ